MVKTGGRPPSRNVVDARMGRIAIGVIGALALGAVGVGLAGVETVLGWVGLGRDGAPPLTAAREESLKRFSAQILGDTERVWSAAFAEEGRSYAPPTLVLHNTEVASACGPVPEGRPPSYCVIDQRIFVDLAFFNEVAARFDAPVDFPPAFVIAHEVGHHVQNLNGDYDRAAEDLEALDPVVANEALRRLELQADCLAGVWARRADDAYALLEPGDVEEALATARLYGGDVALERRTGLVVEQALSAGSAEERARWVLKGFEAGETAACDLWEIPLDAL